MNHRNRLLIPLPPTSSPPSRVPPHPFPPTSAPPRSHIHPIPPHPTHPHILSHPHQEDGFRPGLVGGLLAQERVLAIVAGRYFTLAISQHGRLFTWGANLYTGDAPWRHEHDSGFDDDADAAADEFPEKGPAGTAGSSSEREAWRQRLRNAALAAAQPRVVEAGVEGEQVVEVDVGTDHWVALTGSGIVLVCHTGFTPQGIRVDPEQHRSWLGVAPGVPLDRPAAVRVPPHLGSHPGGGEEGRAAGPEVQSVAAAHHTTFAVTADYKAVSWGEAGPLLGRAWGEGQGQVPANRPGVVGSGAGGGGAVGGEGVVGLDRQTVEQVSAGEGFAVARLSHGVVYSWGDNQHGQLGRPAPSQDGTPALVQGLEQLEVLLVVAGSQQGLVLCRALQGSEAALEPQEFDDTRVLNEEHVSPASLPDPDASAPAAAVPVPGGAGGVGAGFGAAVGAAVGAAGGAVRAMVAGGEGTAVASAAGGGDSGAGENWGERVGGGASAAEQGGTGGEGLVARDMWMKFGEEFKMLPRQGMDSSMRNPCWRVQAGSAVGSAGTEGGAGPEVHCLPYFFIIGATRAGTQDLYRKLTSSIIPGIFPAAIPNPQWWDRNGARDFAWYVSLFDEAAQHMVNTGGSAVTGEASSTLLTSSGVVLRGHVDDRHTVPQLLHLVLPRSKFIVILRNPVDRFFSEFNLAAAVNPSPSVPRDFHKYARDATARMSACVEKEGAHACVRKLFRDMPDLCGSFYAYFIQDWFRSFHPQAFLFLRFEDYMANPRPHIAQTLDFLGFPAADVAEEQWVGIIDLERVEQRPEGMAREELDGVTREYLEAFFAPFNADLVRLLRDEKYSWKRGQR
ncbi:unnamed protein product [Closterium sp. Naga37s-1]|nr:unnamed protein product [Closterium sp. Naga37s-1]